MDENELQYVVCRNGVFVLPERIMRTLSEHARGAAYLREDDDMLTIATERMTDAWRRPLTPRFRCAMFRDATRLAIVDLNDMVQVIGVTWRKAV